MNDGHPAMIAARSSWDCVQRRAREEWLALMAEDVTIVHGIFTYSVNEAGRLRALRGYWSLDEMKVEKPA